jgi:predicted transcriptional regulator
MVTTRSQKEKRVIELYEQGKTIREIAEEVHMSFAAIISIIKKHTGEDKDKEKTTSKVTQAIKLYSQGKSPVDAVIELDLTPEEAKRVYREFCMLKNQHHLDTTYEEIQNDMPSILKLFKMIKKWRFAEKDILELLRHSNQLPSLDRVVDTRLRERKLLEHQIQNISQRFYELQEKTKILDDYLEEHQLESDELENEINSKLKYLASTEARIEDLINGEDHLKINEIIENEVTSLLNNKNILIIACIVTALLAIRNDPNKEVLIHYFDYYHNPKNHFSDTNNVENYIQTNHTQLLEIIDMFHDKVLKFVRNQIFPSLPKHQYFSNGGVETA